MFAQIGKGLRISRLPVTATTNFLAPDILNRCGRAIPAENRALGSTLRPMREQPSHYHSAKNPASMPGDPKYIHVMKSERQSTGDGERLFTSSHSASPSVITATRCEPSTMEFPLLRSKQTCAGHPGICAF